MLTTCPGCGRQWTGVRQLHCSACHEHFTVVRNFDKHLDVDHNREPSVQCRPPGSCGLVTRDTSRGPVWLTPAEAGSQLPTA